MQELPAIDTTAAGIKRTWDVRGDGLSGARPENGGDEGNEEFDEDCDANCEDASGGGNRDRFGRSDGSTSAAHDWFAATRHGRDDAVGRTKRFSVSRGPGWEETYAFRRSAARRGLKKSTTATGKVGRVVPQNRTRKLDAWLEK